MGFKHYFPGTCPGRPGQNPSQTTNCPRYAEAEDLNGGREGAAARGLPCALLERKIPGNLPLYIAPHLQNKPSDNCGGRAGKEELPGDGTRHTPPRRSASEKLPEKPIIYPWMLPRTSVCMCLPAKSWAGQKKLPETGFHVPSRREKARAGQVRQNCRGWSFHTQGKLILACPDIKAEVEAGRKTRAEP